MKIFIIESNLFMNKCQIFYRLSEISLGLSSITDIPRSFTGNADNSECSTNTNTEEYATCTDTSRRTPGMRTTLTTTTTTTSSSSTTQVPGLNPTQLLIVHVKFKQNLEHDCFRALK